MSIKENMNFIKREIGTQEEFLSGFLKVEKYYKKYKNYIYLLSVVAVIAIISTISINYINDKNKLKANEAYNKLLSNPNDKEALFILQDLNKKLYDIISYKKNQKSSMNDDLIYLKGLISFQNIKDQDNIDEINKILQDNNFLLKDYVIFMKALILTKQGKLKQAKDSLKFIAKESPIAELSNILNHHLSANGAK